MEPILPEPISSSSHEVTPEISQDYEATHNNTETAPNTKPSQPHETTPLRQTQPSQQQLAVPQAVPQTSSPSSQAIDNQQSGAKDDPLIADDVDVIEKEWVDKAKRIVNSTKSDPHAQEKEISKLQADYLLKRYNKKVKVKE